MDGTAHLIDWKKLLTYRISRITKMTMTSANPPTAVGRELVITRMFNAPREHVFQMWTDPLHLSKWWSPKHFTNPVCEVDARPGGSLHVVMQDPDGGQYPMTG